MTYTIDRRTWRRGKLGEGEGQLLNYEGFKCCLGFVAIQDGVPADSIIRIGLPSGMIFDKNFKSPIFGPNKCISNSDDYYFSDSFLTDEAYKINDDTSISEEMREEALKEIFKRYGHEIQFFN